MLKTFKNNLDWVKQGFILVVLLRLAVFFSYYLITFSSATKATELVDMNTPSYAL